MSNCKRHGKRWNTAELLRLNREYELLQWSVQEIADKHERSVQSILFKLHEEGLTPSVYEANGYVASKDEPDVSSDNMDINTLTERVWSLETSVGEISTMVKQMFDKMNSSSKKVLARSR